MNQGKLLPGAIVLLALALFANAVAMFLGNRNGAGYPPAAEAQPARDRSGNIYYLGSDTYVLTSNSDGDQLFLWKYKFHPRDEENTVTFLRMASAR